MKSSLYYDVLFADDSLVAFNKRSGVLTAADRYAGCQTAHSPACPQAQSITYPRLDIEAGKEFGHLLAVHRLDRDTSGVILYARNAPAQRALAVQFEQHKIRKIYHCLVRGRPTWQNTAVDAPLLLDGDAMHRTVVNRKGKPSITEFRLLGVCGQFSWIEARPLTGRTHQIRAHLKSLGMSIACDGLYGSDKLFLLSEVKRKWRGDEWEERPLLSRMALHALSITFIHPATGESITVTAPYQKDMDAVRKQLFKIFKIDPLLHGNDTPC